MNILQINTTDGQGGAERIALSLHANYRRLGHNARLLVGTALGDTPGVQEIVQYPGSNPWIRTVSGIGQISSRLLRGRVRGAGRVQTAFESIAHPSRAIAWWNGREYFGFPGSREISSVFDSGDVGIVQAHNLHGGYFDLTTLPQLSTRFPVCLTLHDAWLLSGHCAHSFDCERWITGCGECPDLSIYPAIRKDATAQNWLMKHHIFENTRCYVSTPSRWLMEKVEQSILAQSVIESRVIPNGIDRTVFYAGDMHAARSRLGLPPDTAIIITAANGIRNNIWKDYRTLRGAIERYANNNPDKQTLFLGIGDSGPEERIGQASVRFVPFQEDASIVADYYRAADIYIHAARADTFPSTVIEALSCGTPVIATAIGGIPEQVTDGVTGFLVPPGDKIGLTEKIELLLDDKDMLQRFSNSAATDASSRFDQDRMAGEYVHWFEEILENQKSKTS